MKRKPLPYKRGDQVVYLRIDQYGIHVTPGEVTAVRNDELVYVKTVLQPHGNVWKHTFGRTPGTFQENPSPLWRLRHLNGANIKSLEKRARQATALHREHREAVETMERELEREVFQWKCNEREKRTRAIPHGWDYLNRVAARMGFKVPKNTM